MMRIVTAIFETRAEAEHARDGLLALGLQPGSVALHSKTGREEVPATDAAPGAEPWLPALLDMLFLPDPENAAHRATLEGGGVAVCARVEPERAESAAQTLEAAGGRYMRNTTQPVMPTS